MGNIKDLTGNRIGHLLILKRKREYNRTYYLCKCDCGKEIWIRADNLTKKNNVANCGCKKEYVRYNDVSNKKFGLLTAINIVGNSKNNGYVWNCKCDCGNYKKVSLSNLVSGRTTSCGCNQKNKAKQNITKAFSAFKNKHIKDNTNMAYLCRDKPIKNNTSGVTGVTFNKRDNIWVALITFKNKRYYLGSFKNKDDAISARKEAEESLHKNFLRSIDSERKNNI